MASNDKRRPALNRRDFLRYNGIGLALFSIPACGDAILDLGEDQLDLTGATPSEWITVQRASDLVNLRVGLYNVQRSADKTKLVCTRPLIRPGVYGPAYIVVELAPQHLFEQITPEGYATAVPVSVDMSAESRIGVLIPIGVNELPFNVEGLLTALRNHPMNVSANAAPTPGVTGTVTGVVSGDPGIPRPPEPLETSIELPWRLQLSPNEYGRWDHPIAPRVSTRGRVELWHTRLGVSGVRGAFDDRPCPQRTLRALWNRDRDTGATGVGFTGSLDGFDRQKLVDQTSVLSQNGANTIAVDRLALSALGGWLDANANFTDNNPIKRWVHRTAMGRDTYVEVTYSGFAYPTRHRFMLVKISERRLDQLTGGYAILWQRYLIVPAEQTCTYDQLVDPNNFVLRHCPIYSITFPAGAQLIDPPWTTEPTGEQYPPPFVPKRGGRTLRFDLELRDRDGNRQTINTPIVWTFDPGWGGNLAGLEGLLRGVEPHTDFGNQRMWLAPANKPGDTTFEIKTAKIAGVSAGGGAPWFHPVVDDVEMSVPALRQVAGNDATRTFRYSSIYIASGFDPAQNPREHLLALAEPTQPIRLNFTAQADQVGGFIAPNLDVQGLSRLAGPVSDIVSTGLSVDPTKLFGQIGSLSSLLGAKLFGCLDLAEIIGKVAGTNDFTKMVPSFVTDAMHEVERYQKLADDVLARITRVKTELEKVITEILNGPSIEARLDQARQQIREWIDQQTAALDALITQTTRVVRAMGALPNAVGQTLPPGTEAPEKTEFDEATTAWTGSLTTIANALVSNKALPYVYPLSPGLETIVRDFAGILRRVVDVTNDVKAAVTAFLKGVELAKSQQLTLDWRPPIKPWTPSGWKYNIFEPRGEGGLVLAAVIRGKPQGTAKAGVDLRCGLEKFDLALGDTDDPYIKLHFDKFEFRRNSGKKPEIDVVFSPKCPATPSGMLEFCGPLSFVQTIKDALPLDGFSDPPDVKISPTGITASFSQGLPNIGCGIFSIENLAISAGLDVPFVGDSMRFRFAFASREKPFLVSVAFLGGTGYFGIEVDPKGIVAIEAQIEFGAHLSIDLGVASGAVTVMAGLYFRMERSTEQDKSDSTTITLGGFLRIRGEVDVLGLISASIELMLTLNYISTGEVYGEATLVIEVSIGFFSTSVSLHAERRFAGAGGGASQTNGPQTMAQLQQPGRNTFDALMPPGSGFWESYCGAFATDDMFTILPELVPATRD